MQRHTPEPKTISLRVDPENLDRKHSDDEESSDSPVELPSVERVL